MQRFGVFFKFFTNRQGPRFIETLTKVIQTFVYHGFNRNVARWPLHVSRFEHGNLIVHLTNRLILFLQRMKFVAVGIGIQLH